LKNLLIFILLFSNSFANNQIAVLKTKIIKDIANILIKKKIIKVYVSDPDFYDIFHINKHIVKADGPTQANLILTNNSLKYAKLKNKPCIISTNYQDYKNHTSIDIGAFFWQKGRPNIILNEKMLKQKHITLPKQYDQYAE